MKKITSILILIAAVAVGCNKNSANTGAENTAGPETNNVENNSAVGQTNNMENSAAQTNNVPNSPMNSAGGNGAASGTMGTNVPPQ